MKISFMKLILIFGSIFIFTGCDSTFVSSVKEAEYVKGLSVEDLFVDSGYCDSLKWSEIENKKYKKLVNVECVVDKERQVFQGQDVLVFNFKNINSNVEIFNSYYKNNEGKTVGGIMRKWQSELLLEGMKLQIEENS